MAPQLLKRGMATPARQFSDVLVLAEIWPKSLFLSNFSGRLGAMANDKPQLRPRPPVVVVMGHVDHGKTTLLDYIRKTNVAGKEAGGITQSIGAYEITHAQINADKDADERRYNISVNPRKNPRESAPAAGRKITFIDTPGHEAFSKMRARGANIADLAILVVAADEGVKPQTQESIRVLTETKTPFIVAITKIDKTGADMEKIKNELTAAGVLLEGYGGQISYCGVSSKTGDGINGLLDLILLLADVENLTFDPDSPASGYVLETKMDRRRGSEATIIVKNGVLRMGDEIGTQTAKGKVKILENFLGQAVDELEPSSPAAIYGFDNLPLVGEEFFAGEKSFTKAEREENLTARVAGKSPAGEGEVILRLILKSADAGSLEALSMVTENLRPKKGRTMILQKSVGDVNDNDVKFAIAAGAVIFGFKNKIDKSAELLAESHGVKVITSEIIYDLVKAAEEYLISLEHPAPVGELNVLAVFNQKKLSEQLVGGRVVGGIFRNKATIEIRRGSSTSPSAVSSGPNDSGQANGGEGEAVGTGKILNLREGKKNIAQAETDKEIGLLIDSKNLIAVGDRLVVRK